MDEIDARCTNRRSWHRRVTDAVIRVEGAARIDLPEGNWDQVIGGEWKLTTLKLCQPRHG